MIYSVCWCLCNDKFMAASFQLFRTRPWDGRNEDQTAMPDTAELFGGPRNWDALRGANMGQVQGSWNLKPIQWVEVGVNAWSLQLGPKPQYKIRYFYGPRGTLYLFKLHMTPSDQRPCIELQKIILTLPCRCPGGRWWPDFWQSMMPFLLSGNQLQG